MGARFGDHVTPMLLLLVMLVLHPAYSTVKGLDMWLGRHAV